MELSAHAATPLAVGRRWGLPYAPQAQAHGPCLELIRHLAREKVHWDLVPKLMAELSRGVARLLHHVADVGCGGARVVRGEGDEESQAGSESRKPFL